MTNKDLYKMYMQGVITLGEYENATYTDLKKWKSALYPVYGSLCYELSPLIAKVAFGALVGKKELTLKRMKKHTEAVKEGRYLSRIRITR